MILALLAVGLTLAAGPSLAATFFCPCVPQPGPGKEVEKDRQPDTMGGHFVLVCTNISASGNFAWSHLAANGRRKVIGRCVFVGGRNSTFTVNSADGMVQYFVHICRSRGGRAVVNIYCKNDCTKLRLTLDFEDGKWMEDLSQRVFTGPEDFDGMSPADENDDSIPDEGFRALLDGLYEFPPAELPADFETRVTLAAEPTNDFTMLVWDVGELEPVIQPEDFVLLQGVTSDQVVELDDSFTLQDTEFGLRLQAQQTVSPQTGQQLVSLAPGSQQQQRVQYSLGRPGAVEFYRQLFAQHPETPFHELYCSPDPNLGDLPGSPGGTGQVTVGPQQAQSRVSLGSQSQQTATISPGQQNVQVLQFDLSASSQEALQLLSLTLDSNGSGDDRNDINAVNLWADVNGDGSVDAGDTLLSEGAFDQNDGEATLDLRPGRAILAGGSETFLVTYDFNTLFTSERPTLRLAQSSVSSPSGPSPTSLKLPLGWVALGLLLSFGLLGGGGSRRLRLLGLSIVLLMGVVLFASCGGDDNTGRSYRPTLRAVNAVGGSSGQALAVGGLPLAGGTVTIR